MLGSKCLSDVACEYADLVYEEFLNKVYGVNACLNHDIYDDREDYRLQLMFLESGYRSDQDLKNMGVNISYLERVQGIGFYNIYNTTNISNTYNTYTATGYVHNQASASSIWTIINPLNFCPNVSIVDTNGQEIGGQVTRTDDCSIITISFNNARAGKAYLS